MLIKTSAEVLKIIIDNLSNAEMTEYNSQLLPKRSEKILISKNLSGKWMLTEKYEDGITTADVNIIQEGSELKGYMIISDKPDDEEEFIINESITGFIDNNKISLSGTGIRVIKGELEKNEYNLDQWRGEIVDINTIEGFSIDEDGTHGKFSMKRISE
jgi:hypothetical protein